MGKVSFGASVDAEVLREVDAKRNGSRNKLIQELLMEYAERTPAKTVPQETIIPSYIRELRDQIFRTLRRGE